MTAALTLRAIARELELPESTVRYYRDAFTDHLPASGRGRRRRYPAESVPMFRTIAEGFAEGRSREEIASQLGNGSVAAAPEAPGRSLARRAAPDGELLSLVLDGERERREVMWQLAREIVRLGEAVERQHTVIGQLASYLERQATRSLPPATSTAGAPDRDVPRIADELASLRKELEKERELVERLRRSKMQIERRAAEAEAALEAAPQSGGSFFGRGRARGDAT